MPKTKHPELERRKRQRRAGRSAPTRKPHLTLLPNGHVRVGGLNYQDFRSLITAASLWRMQDEQDRERKIEAGTYAGCQCRACEEFYIRQKYILDTLEQDLSDEINRVNGYTPRTPSLKERLKESDQLRQILKDLTNA